MVLGWRNYKPYTDRIKAGYAAIAAGAADTAEKLANRAMILNWHSGPRPYDILWRAAKIKNDEANEIKCDLTMARQDARGRHAERRRAREPSCSRYRPYRAGFRRGQDRQGAEGQAVSRCGGRVPPSVLKEFPTSEEAPFAMQGITISAAIVGDTAISNAAVAVIKANS